MSNDETERLETVFQVPTCNRSDGSSDYFGVYRRVTSEGISTFSGSWTSKPDSTEDDKP